RQCHRLLYDDVATVPDECQDVFRMSAALRQHHHDVRVYRLHHIVHVLETRDRELLADTFRLGPHDITHRSQLRVGNLSCTEQLRVALCNPPATDQCEPQHSHHVSDNVRALGWLSPWMLGDSSGDDRETPQGSLRVPLSGPTRLRTTATDPTTR